MTLLPILILKKDAILEKRKNSQKTIEFPTTFGHEMSGITPARENMAKRASLELKDGNYVNLGIGIPTLVANYVENNKDIVFQSENGLLGIGPFPKPEDLDADLINAGKQTISAAKGSSFFSSADSFAMIRGGHIDISILGGLEVSETGDLANFMIPNKMVKGPGGAMDLVSGVKKVVVLLEHRSKNGASKILKQCKLPLTGKGVVDLIITDLAVFKVLPHNAGLLLTEVMPSSDLEKIKQYTEAKFKISENLVL
jgi:3-oxoacid CoA-transferase